MNHNLQVLQILRLNIIWGPYSLFAPPQVTNWTGAGWLCRIYLTASLGLLAPFIAWFTFFLVLAGSPAKTLKLQRQDANQPSGGNEEGSSNMNQRPKSKAMIVVKAVIFASLCTLPIAILQSSVAWISIWVGYQGESLELQPRSVLGYFFATFWYGTTEQCSDHAVTNEQCTMCVFPAAAAIIHAIWTVIFLISFWIVTKRLSKAVINRSLKRRVASLSILLSAFASLGIGCIGASVAFSPFSWPNQGCWLGYVATVVATSCLITWKVTIYPVHEMHVASKRALAWHDPEEPTRAQAVVTNLGDIDTTKGKVDQFVSGKRTFPFGRRRNDIDEWSDTDTMSASGVLLTPLGDGMVATGHSAVGGIIGAHRPPSASSTRSYGAHSSTYSWAASTSTPMPPVPVGLPLGGPSAPMAPSYGMVSFASPTSRPPSAGGGVATPGGTPGYVGRYWQYPYGGSHYQYGNQRSRASSTWSMGSWGYHPSTPQPPHREPQP